MTLKTYALVRTSLGTIERRQQFDEGQQPVLAAAKDRRWLLDEPPSFNEAFQTRTETTPIPAEATGVPYVVATLGLAALRLKRKAVLAEKRWQLETGGITISGASIRTDRESQALITGAKVAIDVGAISSVDWKASNGFVTLNGVQVTAIATAVCQHVQACFSNEKALAAALDAAGSDTGLTLAQRAAQILAVDLDSGWP